MSRRNPYTEAGLRRCQCFRCGQPAQYQWSICSLKNWWHPVCQDCDISLNRMVLKWSGVTDWKERLAEYRLQKTKPVIEI